MRLLVSAHWCSKQHATLSVDTCVVFLQHDTVQCSYTFGKE